MPEGYLHLTCEQRCQIYAFLQSGHSQAHIARQIGVDPSTISRELVSLPRWSKRNRLVACMSSGMKFAWIIGLQIQRRREMRTDRFFECRA